MGSSPRLYLLEIFGFKNEDDYEYQIWLQVFSRLLII